MAQTTTLVPKLRTFYKKYFAFLGLGRLIHFVVSTVVNTYARLRDVQFPKKFDWEWKLEMLLDKYESETVELFKEIIKPTMNIVDIGAHIGYFSVLYSKLVGPDGHVYAFEADPENYKLLEYNTRRLKNISRNKKAVSEHTGTVDFYHIENSTGCHSVIDPDEISHKITVDSVALDDLITSGEIEKVDIIKIDIEGGEPLAFKGMKRLLTESSNIQLITEFNQGSLTAGGVTPEQFLMQLKSFGFTVFCITNHGLVPIDSLEKNDVGPYLHPTGYVNLYCKK